MKDPVCGAKTLLEKGCLLGVHDIAALDLLSFLSVRGHYRESSMASQQLLP